MKWWFGLIVAAASTSVLWAQAPDPELVREAVRKAGLPAELVEIGSSSQWTEAVPIGRKDPNGEVVLTAVYFKNQYLSAQQATREAHKAMSAESAWAWVKEVLLAFEKPLEKETQEFTGRSLFSEPSWEASGPNFKVRLWVRDLDGLFSIRTYTLSSTGFSWMKERHKL